MAFQYGPSLHSDRTLFLCQHGTREALNVTFRDAQRFSPEAWGREKRTNDAFADTCFKCQEGGFAREFWPQRSEENSPTSVLAPVRGLTLSFVWNGLISFRSDMIFYGLQDNLLRLYIRVAVILRRKPHTGECILNSDWQNGASWASWVGDVNFVGFWALTRWWQNTS